MLKTKRKEYEKFKLQWMIDHGYTLFDLIHELQMMIDESDGESLKELFEDWEYGFGFNSEIWPCYDEWLDYDGSDEDEECYGYTDEDFERAYRSHYGISDREFYSPSAPWNAPGMSVKDFI